MHKEFVVPVSAQQLREAYLPREMECYLRKKLVALPVAEFSRRVDEALKFLHMSSELRGSIPVTSDIDDVWHLWILETREYAKLCAAIPGTTFIDHCSDAF